MSRRVLFSFITSLILAGLFTIYFKGLFVMDNCISELDNRLMLDKVWDADYIQMYVGYYYRFFFVLIISFFTDLFVRWFLKDERIILTFIFTVIITFIMSHIIYLLLNNLLCL